MMSLRIQQLLVVIIAFLYVTPVAANIVWPALFVSNALFATWFLIGVSLAIEALFFYVLIPNITVLKSTCMSLVGNAVSFFAGTICMAVGMVGWHFIFDSILGGTFHPINIVATWVIMCLGSALIELLAVKLFFGYSFKQLFVPVFVGNLITYSLTMAYHFSQEFEAFMTSLRSAVGL